VFADFVISTKSTCNQRNVYAYHFSNSAPLPDYKVKISSKIVLPDLKIQIVDDPKKANLILIDDFNEADMQICKQSTPLNAKVIHFSSSVVLPDITIELTKSSFDVDYKIFVASERMTVEEAAVLYAVVWKANRDN
jgi:hypothetical protein